MPKIIVSLASFRFSRCDRKSRALISNFSCVLHSQRCSVTVEDAPVAWPSSFLPCCISPIFSSYMSRERPSSAPVSFRGSVICLFAMSPRVPLVFRLALWLLSVFTIHPCFTLCRPAPCARLEKFQLLPPSFLLPHLSSLTCPHRHIFMQLLQAV